MKKFNLYRALLCLLVSLFTAQAYAWDHSIEVGYGRSEDPNHNHYTNSGFLLSGDLYPFWHTPYTFWSLNGAIGQWYASAPVHRNLTTVALALALRVYPLTTSHEYSPYLLGSVGPAYLSSRKFGYNTQGANVDFQVNAGLGVELGKLDLNLRVSHYSNAHLANPDQGFTVLYLLSMGYLF